MKFGIRSQNARKVRSRGSILWFGQEPTLKANHRPNFMEGSSPGFNVSRLRNEVPMYQGIHLPQADRESKHQTAPDGTRGKQAQRLDFKTLRARASA